MSSSTIQRSTPIRLWKKLAWSSVYSAEVSNSGLYLTSENRLLGD